ncbi:unnamed protein product [Allacma fusca]|uniref:Uncharacterized protein n=1 Tax=Allacma fusca TaxID=39272 RepID=A0A8J2KBX0_9HEXA|nr:unnamed protein product [Allacma fusca]
MLGPIARKYLFIGYDAAIWYCIVPFEWETKEKKRVRSARSKFRIFRFYENTAYSAFGIAWCGIRMLQLSEKSENSKTDLIYYIISVIMTTGLVFPTCLYINYVWARDELVSFAYDFIDYGTRFQDKYVLPLELERQRSKAHDSSGIFIASLWYIQNIVFTSAAILTMFMPELPLLLTGTFEFQGYIRYPVIGIQAIIILGFLITWFTNQCIYSFPGIEYVFALVYMLKEMEIGPKKGEYTTRSRLRSAQDFILNYRALQVLHAKAMYVYSPIVLPANEWSYIFLATYSIFGAVRSDGIMALIFMSSGFLLLYYLFTVFLVFSKVYQTSESVIRSWKREKHLPWVSKALKSLTPITISVGGHYFVDHGMMLQMYRSVLKGTSDLLMI